MIAELFEAKWGVAPQGPVMRRPLPEKPLDEKCYQKGRFLQLAELGLKSPWNFHVPDWKSLRGGKRDRFTKEPIVEGVEPGAELEFPFEGTAVGAYILAGPDAGIVEASVDGGAPRKVNLFHNYSANLHYPRTVLFADGLAEGTHTLKLKISEDTDGKAAGHAFRALHFVVNGGKR
jgi:hypothetical protein